MIRFMKKEDYPEVYALWKSIKGFGIRSVDDSREKIEQFLVRNPSTSFVAEEDGRLVGALLCGHDGRRACFYHVCVREEYRSRGIASAMVREALCALKKEGISKVNLVAFVKNQLGNDFWKGQGWTLREDLNYYDKTINEENVIEFNL